MDCLFCKIGKGETDSTLVYEDNDIVAFNDINPQAPHHILIIPKQHIPTINDLGKADSDLIGKMILTAKNLANKYKIADAGYRLVLNCNDAGGQEVYHIHLHLLGGRAMAWPPG